jgi:aspartate/methionine/tyrosine aminotransferase
MFALPGIKIGWMTVTGDHAQVRRAMSGLELISDTFLPVNEIAQFAVEKIFVYGQEFLRSYGAWVKRCRDSAIEGLAGLNFVEPRGGFYITLPIAAGEEAAAQGLLENNSILVHPGYFYDIDPDHLVMTFIHDATSIAGCFRTIAMKFPVRPEK